MSVELTARDYRSLTGLQGRAFNKGSTSTTSGILGSYRGGLEIDVNPLQPDQLLVGTGGLFVDGAFVEVTETLAVQTNTDGIFKLVCTVNLASNSAVFELISGEPIQDNLTATNTGIYQFELGILERTGAVISNWNMLSTYIVENLYDYINNEVNALSNEYVSLTANQTIYGNKRFENTISARAYTVYLNSNNYGGMFNVLLPSTSAPDFPGILAINRGVWLNDERAFQFSITDIISDPKIYITRMDTSGVITDGIQINRSGGVYDYHAKKFLAYRSTLLAELKEMSIAINEDLQNPATNGIGALTAFINKLDVLIAQDNQRVALAETRRVNE